MKYTIKDIASILRISIPEAYRRLAEAGIIVSPEQQTITELGKQYAEDKYVEKDRYGRSYWLRTCKGVVVEILRKIK